ncbi:MAG: hypothetical protein F4234_12915 [Gammaproteobacteria bacterium]|nr:hypothetical protein [Gammaproteobacteria bacterium]
MKITSDIQDSPGDPVPFLVGDHRPDIYAADLSQDAKVNFIIAEAKTDYDLDRPHTESQVNSFIEYLEKREQSQFILLTTGIGARRAKSILRFVHDEGSARRTQLAVFDTLDLWRYNSETKKWHLG